MARLLRRRWTATLDAGVPRRDREPCLYDVYVPDPLVGRPMRLDGDVAADVADAEAAIVRLNRDATVLADTEALARLLLRAESVASSRIEHLDVGGRRLLRAEAARALGEELRDVTAAEILGNIDAMAWAVRAVGVGGQISGDVLIEAHRRLLAGGRLAHHAGRLRVTQGWIGGGSYNPCAAEFVPPPAPMIAQLLDDLRAFCNTDTLPAVAQAAVAHAQFETIHPFADGNGRIGRALIHLILRRRGLATRILPPVSLVLATRAADYIAALTGTRYIGAADSRAALDGMNRWMAVFASACRRAVEEAERFEATSRALQQRWRERVGRVRAGSATDMLLRTLPGAPIVTVGGAAELSGRTFQAANQAITRLVDARILTQVNLGRRNRAFEAPEVIDAFADLERELAVPPGRRPTPPNQP